MLRRFIRRRDDRSWLRELLGPAGEQLSCEACFTEVDRYVDLALAGADADAAVPGMRAHLEGCRACREEHDLLLRAVSGP